MILRKEERPVALVALVVFVLLNAMLIYNHYDSFTRGAHVGFWSVFYNHLGMSGYDVFSLIFISCMRLHWNALRHPLFVAVLLPLYWINHTIMPPTEFNFAVFLMAAVLVACDVWGVILLHRILRDIVGCTRKDTLWLIALFYGFAHIMITTMVPDHFALSLPLLLLTLLLTGRKLQEGKRFTYLQQALLFMLTAEQIANGYRYDKRPMGCHDVHLVDTEAEAYVHKHIEAEPRHHNQEELAAACHPCPGKKQHQDNTLYKIIEPMAIAHKHGAGLLHILKEVVAVQLQRLAEEVVYYCFPTRCRHIAPLQQWHLLGKSLSVLLLYKVVVLLQLVHASRIFLLYGSLNALYALFLRLDYSLLLPHHNKCQQQCRHHKRRNAAPRKYLLARCKPCCKRHLYTIG